VLSFHATKVFNTFEGGAIICPDAKTKQRIDHLKNFGFVDDVTVVAPGINGKMSEFNAALGVLQLKYVDQVLARRKEIDGVYRKRLDGVKGIRCLNNAHAKVGNYSYFPIVIDVNYPISRDELFNKLKDGGIHPRRYFYPLISEFSMYRGLNSSKKENLPIATSLTQQVLCLPIYPDLANEVVEEICRFIAAQGF